VKYKVLKSIAHNLTHLFVNFTNYVDDEYVNTDLRKIARDLNDDRLSIIWIPDGAQDSRLTPRILESINHWKAELPQFVERSGAAMEMISEFRTDIYLKKNKQIAVEGFLVDDRGRTYVSPVYNF
jgi:hypothetical protein